MDVQAHPGRTDSSGGHTCRTNCGSWGLEYGEYHHHNGGSSSSSSSNTTSTYDYYESEEYKTSQYDWGYETGFSAGERAYKNGQEMGDFSLYGSEYYQNGYAKGYEEGYYKAKQQDYYATLGEEQGYELLDLDSLVKDVPTDYQETYSKGYQVGFNRKNTELKNLAKRQGYLDGLNLVEKNSSYAEGDVQDAYDAKYIEGFQEKLVAIKEEGFDAAYIDDQLVIPQQYENIEEAATQFAQGFEENSEAVQIKKDAYEDGFWFLVNKKVEAAAPYDHASTLYDLHYERGKKQALELYKKLAIAGGAAFILLTGILLSLKRRKKNVV